MSILLWLAGIYAAAVILAAVVVHRWPDPSDQVDEATAERHARPRGNVDKVPR